MGLSRKDLIGIQHTPRADIELILDTAIPMKEIIQRSLKKVPTLRGHSVITVFYEASTRTRVSFELAAKYLSADTVNIAAKDSSISKGESLIDTAQTIAAMGANAVVLRHPMAGAADILAKSIDIPVLNAGDGAHEHPTQALLNLFTVKEKKGTLEGLQIAIIGDIAHSRVARSDIWAYTKMGANVRLCAPATLIPPGIERLGVTVHHRVEDAVADADIISVLRLQKERQQMGLFPGLQEYSRLFGINRERLALAAPDALVMHPGPVNQGVEITMDVAYGAQSVITEQVTNGVAVRMALLYLMAGGMVKHENSH